MPKKSLFAIITAAAALLSSCALLPVEETLPEIPVIREYEKTEITQAKVQRGDLILSSDVQCSFEILKQETLSFALGNVAIGQIYVKPGDSVKSGDLLISLEMGAIAEEIASIENKLSKLQLQKEQTIQKRDLEYKRMDVILADIAAQLSALQGLPAETDPAGENGQQNATASYEELLKEQTVQQTKRETIVADYTSQLRELEESIYLQKLRLSEKKAETKKRQLVAGISGTVTYVRDTQQGQRVVKDQHMVVISDWDSACIQVKGDYAAYLPVGKEVTVSIAGKKLQAVVIDPAKSGIKAEAGVTASYLQLLQPDPSLADGNTGSIHIVMDQRTDVLYVDKKAIITSNGETFVYQLDESGLRVIQKVTTGLVCNEYIEILEGLEEGDLVIID